MGAAQATISTQLQDITECSICLKPFTDPRSLPCIHTFCLKCLQTYVGNQKPGKNISCPICRTEFTIPRAGVGELPKNFFIDQLLQIKQTTDGAHFTPSYCDICEVSEKKTNTDKTLATMYCLQCQEKYCDDCLQVHRHSRMSRSHTQVKLDSPQMSASNEIIGSSLHPSLFDKSLCDKHTDQLLSVYCCDCNLVICVVCCVASHQYHNKLDLKDAVVKFRDQLSADTARLVGAAKGLRERQTTVEVQKTTYTRRVAEAEKAINKQAAVLEKLVESSKKKLLTELASQTADPPKQLDNLSHEVENRLLLVDNLKEYASLLLSNGSSAEIARQAKMMHDRVEGLLDFTALEQSQNDTKLLDVKFTASSMFPKASGNVLGRIECNVKLE